MRRRDLLKLGAAAAATLGSPSPIAAAESERSPVPDGRSTAPLVVPDEEIRVAFVIGPGSEVMDFAGPWGVFEYVMLGEESRNPFRLYTVAASTEPIQVSGGMRIVPDFRFADAPQPHVVVVPAMDTDKASPALFAWLRAVHGKASLTMSVCDGAYVLAQAGLLDGKSATAHHGGYGMLAALYPKVKVIRGMRYVEDGKLATSGGLTSGIDLALRVVERYFGRTVAEQTAFQLEHQGNGWKSPASNARYALAPVGGTEDHPVCPVCGAPVKKDPQLTTIHQGHRYFFCSDFCKEHFLKAPGRFVPSP